MMPASTTRALPSAPMVAFIRVTITIHARLKGISRFQPMPMNWS